MLELSFKRLIGKILLVLLKVT